MLEVRTPEEVGDEDEKRYMMDSPCIQRLIELTDMEKANAKKRPRPMPFCYAITEQSRILI